jgi:hypothetical protein
MEPPQHGGKLLGSGVYGCTFEPAPRCAGGNVFKTVAGLPAVGKVTYKDASKELSFGRELMTLPLARQYFAVAATECRPAEPIADPDTDKCAAIEKATQQGSQLDMLIMPSAGESLDAWAKNLPRLATNFRRIFVHLLEGAIIYQGAGIVHNDIHMGNVLVDELGVARYIDFGLSFKVDAVHSWKDTGMIRTFYPNRASTPPEVHAMRMILNHIDIQTGVRYINQSNSFYEKMERLFPARESLTQAITDIQAFLRKYGEVVFLHRYAKQFDAWRIGIIFWRMWTDLMMWGGFKDTDVYRARDTYRRVLGGLTEFNPRKRLTVAAALRLLDPGNRIATAKSPT